MKRCSSFIRKTQIQITIRYYLIFVIIKKKEKKEKNWQVCGERRNCKYKLLMGLQNSVAAMGNNVEVFQKVKKRIAMSSDNPTPRYLLKRIVNIILKRY